MIKNNPLQSMGKHYIKNAEIVEQKHQIQNNDFEDEGKDQKMSTEKDLSK